MLYTDIYIYLSIYLGSPYIHTKSGCFLPYFALRYLGNCPNKGGMIILLWRRGHLLRQDMSRAIVTIPYFSINGYTNHQNMGGWIVVHTDNKKRLSMIWYNYFWYIFWILAWYGYWCYCDIVKTKQTELRRPDQVHNLTCKSGLWGKKGTHITYAPITSHRTQLPIQVSSHNGPFLGQAQLYHVIQVLPSNMVITMIHGIMHRRIFIHKPQGGAP